MIIWLARSTRRSSGPTLSKVAELGPGRVSGLLFQRAKQACPVDERVTPEVVVTMSTGHWQTAGDGAP